MLVDPSVVMLTVVPYWLWLLPLVTIQVAFALMIMVGPLVGTKSAWGTKNGGGPTSWL